MYEGIPVYGAVERAGFSAPAICARRQASGEGVPDTRRAPRGYGDPRQTFDMAEQDPHTHEEIPPGLDLLVDEYRSRCLWFLRPDYYPRTTAEILRVLRQIEDHGDRVAFQRAAHIREWLSRSSSERSAAS